MKSQNVVLIVFAVLFSMSTVLYAESESAGQQPYLGVSLDMRPLPELLTKHLGLSPGQGIRINNIQRDSAADKAGLERDDIIIGFDGKPVEDNEQFVEAVREAGIDKEVTLEIIHLGKRENIKLKLGRFEGEAGLNDWKYPPEPEAMQLWRPGKIFRLQPGDKDWMEIQLNKMPGIKDNLKGFFNELYSFQHFGDGEKYDITIEGNPADESSKITVRISDPNDKMTEYQTTVKEIDKLPEKYRQPARDAIGEALNKSREKKFGGFEGLPVPPPPEPEALRRYFEGLQPRPFEPGNMMPGNMMPGGMQEQLRQLQQRLEQLEKRQEELLNRFPQEPNKQKSEGPENPVQQEKGKVSI